MSTLQYDKLAKLLHTCCNGETGEFNGRYLKVNIELDTGDVSFLTDVGIQYDDANNTLDLKQTNIEDVNIYYGFDDFIKRFDRADKFLELTIIFVNLEGNYAIKHKNAEWEEKLDCIFNYCEYKKILKFIVNSTSFITYDNSAIHEFVLISESGGHRIGYNPIEPKVKNYSNITGLLNRLQDSFRSLEFQGFFKEAVVSTLFRFPLEDRFYQFVLNLSVLLDIADRDYELYIRRFSFDKIKSKFKEERKAYFDSIEKSVESINKQVVSFPLTFSASAFASYQVKDNPLILVLIVLVYSLYTFIAWKVLKMSKTNISNLTEDLFNEAKNILRNYTLIYEEFKPDFKKILFKVKQLNVLTSTLKATLIILLAFFYIFSIYQVISYFSLDSKPTLPFNLLI